MQTNIHNDIKSNGSEVHLIGLTFASMIDESENEQLVNEKKIIVSKVLWNQLFTFSELEQDPSPSGSKVVTDGIYQQDSRSSKQIPLVSFFSRNVIK